MKNINKFYDVEYRKARVDELDILVIDIVLKRPIEPEEARVIADSVYRDVTAEGEVFMIADVVAVSGRLPTWLYSMMTHKLGHIYPALAVYDPKISGFIITVTHRRDLTEGQVIPYV